MKVLLPLFPAMAGFGPLFMVMGSGRPGSLIWIPYVGALMTTVALFTMFFLLATQAKEMQRKLGSTSSEEEVSPHERPKTDPAGGGR